MTDDDIPSLAEALAEIRRLRARIAVLEVEASDVHAKLLGAAVVLGTLEKPQDDEPSFYTHNIPPSAPPHDE